MHSRARAPTLEPMTYSELRASDAERERVVAFLREHALLGRLTDDELEERIGLAYAAVTVGDLETLIADLPRASSPGRAQPPRRPSAPRPSAVRQHHHHHGPPPALIGLGIGALLISGVGIAALGLIVAVGVASDRDRLRPERRARPDPAGRAADHRRLQAPPPPSRAVTLARPILSGNAP